MNDALGFEHRGSGWLCGDPWQRRWLAFQLFRCGIRQWPRGGSQQSQTKHQGETKPGKQRNEHLHAQDSTPCTRRISRLSLAEM